MKDVYKNSSSIFRIFLFIDKHFFKEYTIKSLR